MKSSRSSSQLTELGAGGGIDLLITSVSSGQEMRVREKGLNFIFGGSLLPPYRTGGLPAAPPPGGR